MSNGMNMDEQYERAKIFSYNQINQKWAKVCSVCGRTIACCRWTGNVSGSSWKYCLDCQDDHFEDWRLEWNNYIIAKSVSLSLEERHGLSERCSKTAYEVPLFPFPPRDTQDEEDNMSENTRTRTDHIDVDSSFSPHNDPVLSPDQDGDKDECENNDMCPYDGVQDG